MHVLKSAILFVYPQQLFVLVVLPCFLIVVKYSPSFVCVLWVLYGQGDLHSTIEYQSLLGSLDNACLVNLFYFDHSVSVVFTHF